MFKADWEKCYFYLLLFLIVILNQEVNAYLDPLNHSMQKPINNLYKAGFKELHYDNQQNSLVALWYPTLESEKDVKYWLWDGYASFNGQITRGKYPLLVFSHGMGGIAYSQYYLAEALARQGYIVAAIDHKDRAFTMQTLLKRPEQTTHILDNLLIDPMLSPFIDIKRIGVIGHSLGGTSALLLAGAKADFSESSNLCLSIFDSEMLCGSKISNYFNKRYVNYKNNILFRDARVKVIIALAPGFPQFFTKAALQNISIPALIIEASKDEIIKQKFRNVDNVNYDTINGGHYSFLPLCNKEVMKDSTEICQEPSCSMQRQIFHELLIDKVGIFLREHL